MPRVMFRMLVVETIGKIRRLHEVESMPVKAICRRLGVSRKVVRKVLRSGATEFRYERGAKAGAKSSTTRRATRPPAFARYNVNAPAMWFAFFLSHYPSLERVAFPRPYAGSSRMALKRSLLPLQAAAAVLGRV